MQQRFKILFLLALVPFLISAQTELSKNVNRSFQVNDDTKIELKNKFGKLLVETWDQPELKVDIEIKVEKKNESMGQQILDRIDVDISESTDRIAIKTDISGNINYKKGETIKIEFNVKMPKANYLDADMSFGEMYVGALESDARLDISYGDLRIESVAGTLDLESSFSNVSAVVLNEGKIIVKYGDLRVREVGRFELEKQFANVEIGKAFFIDLNSKYGELELRDVGSLSGSASFTDITIDVVRTRLDLKTSYGDGVEVNKLMAGFEKVNLEGKFGGFDITLDDDTAADIHVETSFADFNYADVEMEISKMIQGMNKQSFSGKVRGGGNPITIESSYSDVKLRK